jgi:hypothetical protein
VVYGEDLTDTSAIRELVEALAPDWRGRVHARRTPPIEVKNARLEELPKRRDRLAAAIDVERVSHEVSCVFAHEDCDELEPAHEDITARIEKTMTEIGCPVYAVTPAWELEAWWFLWPEAVAATRSSWRAPDEYLGKNVGLIQNAKEHLQRAVVPAGLNQAQKRKFRGYQPSDAPAVARTVRERGEVASPRAQSKSFEWFAARVSESRSVA